MRAIVGYTPDVVGRTTAIAVVATRIGGPPVDISSSVISLEVTDTLDRSPSTAKLTLSREAETWGDPATDPTSPLAIGARLSITMGDWGGTQTQVFEGQIIGGGTDTDDPLAHTSVAAVGGYASWWNRRVTSPEYINQDSDDITADLFVTWGELAFPGDFDLPGAGRNLGFMQVLERPIMDVAHDIYGPTEAVPWWDPVQEKLSTLPSDIPIVADLTLADLARGGFKSTWVKPRGTRVSVQAGTQRDITRIEIDRWTTPLNKDPLGDDIRKEGVRWASGSKGDWALPAYWAHDDETGQHYGVYDPGPPKDYLWVRFLKDETGPAGAGYVGPEGVRFVQNDPLISTDPVSVIQFGYGAGSIAEYCEELSHLHLERWEPAANRMVTQVKVVIDVEAFVPPPTGYVPGAYWERILSESDMLLDFDIIGRQMATGSLEQFFAQAWDDDLIAVHGDISWEVRNDTLLEQTNPLVAVEAEAVRQMALAIVGQHPATLSRKGQDLRLLPGDCIRTPHPRDPVDVLLWAQQVKHTWQSEGARGGTELSGYIVDTIP